MRFALAAVEVNGDSVQLRRFAGGVVNRLLLVNRAVLVAPGQRFAADAQHVVVRKREIAIEIVADDAIGANLPIGIVAVSIKRVLAVNDISCFGRCSLTVALPIISSVGVETLVIPTAILSTHTGGFSGYTFRDLTDDILPVAEHWKQENINVDAVYTGYLGSKRQVGIVSEAANEIKKQGAAPLPLPEAFRIFL